jgi:hypothetical protein
LYKNSYKEMLQRWRPKSDGIPSLSSPTYNAQQSWDKLFLFPKCVSFVCTITRRMIFRSWPATLAISSHANTTNTHTAPSTHLLSLSLSLALSAGNDSWKNGERWISSVPRVMCGGETYFVTQESFPYSTVR